MADIGYQFRKGFDRAGFEADKLMRANRIRKEASRTKDEVDRQIEAIGHKVLQLHAAGTQIEPALEDLVQQVLALQAQLAGKNAEIEAVNAEKWVAPPPPPPPAPRPRPEPQQIPVYAAPSSVPEPEADAPTVSCPGCKAPVREGASFCPSCGRRM